MHKPAIAAALVVAALCLPGAVAAADAPTLLRVFLRSGGSLVSYGEPARVGDRVVFSMPTSAAADSPLQLVNIGADRVDWDRTNRYAASARAAHYVQHQAESDYAVLSNEIAQALNDVTLTTDPARRLAVAETARRRLSDWPADHFGYRAAEIRQMLAMLDEAIADLRASTGTPGRFDLSFAAFSDPTTIVEPVLPPPTPKEAIENVLTAARLVDTAAERTSLLTAVLADLDRDEAAVPAEWAASTRSEVQAAIRTELRADRSYKLLTTRVVAIADRRARLADVPGLQRLEAIVRDRDRTLGGRRPDSVTALIAVIEDKLDAARRLQLARERWALRAPELMGYKAAMATPLLLLDQLTAPLEAIKSLAGSSPAALAGIDRTSARIATLAAAVAPPAELVSAHALIVSSVQLATNAARIRREAAVADDMARAWDASSAAAGALMLATKARTEIQAAVRRPQLK